MHAGHAGSPPNFGNFGTWREVNRTGSRRRRLAPLARSPWPLILGVALKERGQSNRIGFRKYGWYKKVFLEKDGSIIAEPALTGVTKDDNATLLAHKAKCTEKNMAFMNLCTMEVEQEVTFDDVKLAAGKKAVWYVNAAREAEYVLFYIKMEAFKIYAKEWVDWCREYHLKSEELGLPVIVN